MLIEVTEKKTIELALPFFSRDSDYCYYGIMKDEILVRVYLLRDGSTTISTIVKDTMFYPSNIQAALQYEPVTATEFYFALDKAAKILLQQCKL
jgi:phage-related protein